MDVRKPFGHGHAHLDVYRSAVQHDVQPNETAEQSGQQRFGRRVENERQAGVAHSEKKEVFVYANVNVVIFFSKIFCHNPEILRNFLSTFFIGVNIRNYLRKPCFVHVGARAVPGTDA